MEQKVTTFLTFQGSGKKAVDFYCLVFKDSKVHHAMVRPDTNQLLHVSFELNGKQYMAMDVDNSPDFNFTNGISLFVSCEDQAEVDYYWDSLLANGGETMACGWLKDQFGVRWQVIPNRLGELMMDADPEKSGRVFAAMQDMVKINIAELEAAYKGE